VVLAALLAASAAPPGHLSRQRSAESSLDALMREVLQERDRTTGRLLRFAFRETEVLSVRGQDEVAPLQSSVRELAWGERDGLLVREAVSRDGVAVEEPGHSWDPVEIPPPERFSLDRFWAWDGIFYFPYEPGRYFLAGVETFEGQEVLRVEYYPRLLFARPGDGSAIGAEVDATSLVTMLVSRAQRRIVAWHYQSIGLQFLPFRWLVQVGAVSASMIIDAAPDGTWLPRRAVLRARASTAPSQITLQVTRDFYDIREADSGDPVPLPSGEGDSELPDIDAPTSWPPDGEPDTVTAVTFHGNYSLPDGQLGGIAGVGPGDAFYQGLPQEVRARLLGSGLVDRAEVRVRGDNQGGDGAELINVVRQRPGFADHIQVLPLFEWSDEYGVTVGGRASLVNLWSVDDRLSFPLAIGGRDLALVEFVDDYPESFVGGVRASAGYLRQANPHFDEDEARTLVEGRAFKRAGRFQLDVEAGWAEVDFRAQRSRQVSFGLSARYDTRRETGLPRNAVYLAAGWRPLKILDGELHQRYQAQARGYLGLTARSTLVVGGTYDGADGALPPYEQYILGGLETLRGFAPGAFIGDNRAHATVELRARVWEPLPVVVVGVNGFWDTGSVWDDGTSPGKARFHNGVGFGAFLMAAVVQLNVDVGYGIGSGWQFHIGSGLRY